MSEQPARPNATDFYPPVETPTFPPTWQDVERLALHYPQLQAALTFFRRGQCTQEQALMIAVVSLASSLQAAFGAQVELLRNAKP